MARWFFGIGFVRLSDATPCFWICSALRPGTALLQRRPCRFEGPARAASPRQRTVISEAPKGKLDHRDRQRADTAVVAPARDGSGFPFDHFSDIMRLWDA